MKKLFVFVCSLLVALNIQAQNNVFDKGTELTWLGLDFSQMHFVGSASQFKDAGEITDDQLRDKYFAGWNELILKEPKKFDVAKAANRSEVKNAIEVTEKVNNALKKNFFVDDGNKYHTVDEAKVKELVKKYNFQGNKGMGLIFFVEGMSKGKEAACAWVTFVNMDKKEVLWTQRIDGEAGGFGFRNYWAKSFANMMKAMEKKH